MEEVDVGDYIELSSHRCGMVKYLGEVQGKKGTFYGVELWKGDGKHNGTVDDVEYFQCVNDGRGVFVTQKHILYKLDIPKDYDPFKQLAAKQLAKQKKREEIASKYSHLDKKKKKKKTPITNSNKPLRTLPIEENNTTKKEKLEKEKEERLQKEQESKDKLEKDRLHKLQKEREKKEKLERDRKKNEKLEREKKEKLEEERVQKLKIERERKEKLEKERLQKLKMESERKEKHKQQEEKVNNNNNGGYVLNVNDNNYGFPKVHNAFIAYFEDNKIKCTNPTHLVLYAKKKGLDGVGYMKVTKYFKAQKSN
eukprot:470831_1